MAFKRHPDADKRRESAILLIKTLLPMKQLYKAHRRQFLKNALWKLTMAESVHKLDTRYQSEAATRVPRRERQHEHVYQRAKMVSSLDKASQTEIDRILSKAVACAVTEEEHKLLDAYKKLDGWHRYKAAGIAVVDTLMGEKVDLDALESVR